MGQYVFGVLEEFADIKTSNELAIALEPSGNSGTGETILCGIEIVSQPGK
jgi:hypothetical protein